MELNEFSCGGGLWNLMNSHGEGSIEFNEILMGRGLIKLQTTWGGGSNYFGRGLWNWMKLSWGERPWELKLSWGWRGVYACLMADRVLGMLKLKYVLAFCVCICERKQNLENDYLFCDSIS